MNSISGNALMEINTLEWLHVAAHSSLRSGIQTYNVSLPFNLTFFNPSIYPSL